MNSKVLEIGKSSVLKKDQMCASAYDVEIMPTTGVLGASHVGAPLPASGEVWA